MRASLLLVVLAALSFAMFVPANNAQNNPPTANGVNGHAEARLLRFPAIHGNQLVFTYAGDLYTVPATGGIARKLTSHDGFEMFPRFSPDGKTLAFTAQYDGNTEVYVMPAEGGVPKRLTYTATLGRDEVSDRMGPNNIVMSWKNNEIVFRSRMREPNDFIGQLYTISAKGGLPTQLPLPRGGFCSFSPDGKKLAYNRVFREFRTWKRYRGGMADDIWIYDFQTKKIDNITSNDAVDNFPMWHGSKIYFLSDRDANKRFNLYVYDLGERGVRQLTHFEDYDVKFPSLGDRAIVFENAGYIYKFDLATEKAEKVPIYILEDFAAARTGLKDVSKNIASYEISPDGKRALFSARGDLFTLPAKEGLTRNLTTTPGAHDRSPKWSPDGKHIAYISDVSGEEEICIVPQDGNGSAKPLTSGGGPYKYTLFWSPDSKKILWADKKMRLHYVDVESKEVKQIAQAKAFEIREYVWSPDSKWVAYAQPEIDSLQKVYLYSLEQNKSFAVTDGWYLAARPEFSADGKYLFFVSERDFNPTYSETEWNHAYADMERIYLATLSKDTPSPFRPKSDEVEFSGEPQPTPKDKSKEEKKKEAEKKKEPPTVKVDLDGLHDRVLQLPVPPGSYRDLTSVGSSLYYIRSSRKEAKPAFAMFDLTTRKETSLGNIGGYEISANGQKMLVSKDGSYGIIDLPKGSVTISEPLSLSGLQVMLDRRQEWRQIFHEAWRQMRDFFYDPDLHGVDWKAVRARYEPLLAHVNHRADLSYLIGEMISELNSSHAYVGGGDLPKPARIQTGLLGAELRQDDKTKYYQITKILKGSNWDKNLRSPLTELGVNLKEGDWILAVNGKPANEMLNIYEALLNTVGKQVKLRVHFEPRTQGSREVTVVPIADEQPLYYYTWVQGNIKKVSDATKGQVGYIHVPDMLQNGLNEFAKHFYPQLRKKALIIDVRGNGGGNVSPMLIERLRREVAMIDMSRDTAPRPDPFDMLLGPKVCLMNEFSASDGDLFPYRFRHYKLGKLIGKRSWGGVIGIRGSLPFLDGGSLNKPEFASYDLEGKRWIIENHGVDPDIVVDNDPALEYAGVDLQLNRAIEVILEEMRNNPRTLPPVPPFPKR
jgi:tricorn protease